MPTSAGPSLPPPVHLDLEVHGSIPAGLSGQMVGIGPDGVVHSVVLSSAHGASYRTRRLLGEATVRNVLVFGGTILAFGDDSQAHELSADLDTCRLVDLAGQGRVLAPFPKHDPVTRDLHLVAQAVDGTQQSHVVVAASALTRSERPILDAPRLITDFALTADRVLFAASGFVGIAPRTGEARTTWIATNTPALHPFHARDAGDEVVLLALTPSLERWTLSAGSVQREVLDPTPRRFAHLGDEGIHRAPRWVWTTGDDTLRRHDLVHSRHAHHSLRPYEVGDFAVVADAKRPSGDWLVGFVRAPSGLTSDLRVIDAAHIDAPAVATIRVPRPFPHGLRCTWIYRTHTNKENRP